MPILSVLETDADSDLDVKKPETVAHRPIANNERSITTAIQVTTRLVTLSLLEAGVGMTKVKSHKKVKINDCDF